MTTTDRPATGRRGRDPLGRMPLREHLYELRKRVVRSALAVLVGGVAGWFLANAFYRALMRPIDEMRLENGTPTSLNFADPMSAFNQRIQVCLIIGIIIAAPVWLFQFWAFITPGLTKKERRYSYAFVGAALPLFLGGGLLAWYVLPKAMVFLNAFVPEGGSQFIEANVYFAFFTRVILAFGLAFVLPVVMVALNMVGLLPGRVLLKHWRITVFLCFLFAAVVTPTPEATTMCVLAGAMCLLFGAAIALCLYLDRRRAARRSEPDYAAMPDDEASPL